MAVRIQSDAVVSQEAAPKLMAALPAFEGLSTVSPTTVATPCAIERVYRHRLPVRVSHWLNVPFLIILIMSGLQIFNAHPVLYWGDRSDRDQALLSIRPMATESGDVKGITTILV